MKMISWKTTAAEFDLIAKIADRAVDAAPGVYRKQDALMDITAAHCNGCPLDLPGLLAADAFTFSHDVFGIRRHLNRDTGEMMGCFVPRCCAKAEAAR